MERMFVGVSQHIVGIVFVSLFMLVGTAFAQIAGSKTIDRFRFDLPVKHGSLSTSKPEAKKTSDADTPTHSGNVTPVAKMTTVDTSAKASGQSKTEKKKGLTSNSRRRDQAGPCMIQCILDSVPPEVAVECATACATMNLPTCIACVGVAATVLVTCAIACS